MTRKKWYAVIGITILMALGFTAVSIHVARKHEKEQALIFQLKQLRMMTEIYMKIYRVKSPDLLTAMEKKYRFGQPVEWKMKRDATGNPLDPFGNPYHYDKDSGWVYSITKGYEKW